MKTTYKNLFQLIHDQISKRLKFSTTSPYKDQLDRVSISPVTDMGRYSASTGEIITAIQTLLSETLPPSIEEGLEVTATTPISSKVNISAGKGTAAGQLFELEENITNLVIPLDNSTQLFYIVLTKTGLNIEKTFKKTNLTLAKIVVPKPGTTTYIQDNKDNSWNAYIVNMKEYKLYGYKDKFEEDTIELLRNNISPILADNLIGNIRLSENLKILNTQGTLELNSDSLKLLDVNENILAKFNQRGVFLYDTTGKELAKFTGTEGRIGNIRLLPNSIQSSNFVSGSIGFRIKDDGSVEFSTGTFRGTLNANIGNIGGWTLASDNMYATTTGTIKTSINAGAGANGVVLDKDGLRVYDDVLGLVVNLPSDGSAPSFASGIINNTIFEINTNAVLRTSETVGDGSANSAGILINNTGLYGCKANQTLLGANLKALVGGDIYLKGEINASSGQIANVTITSDKLSGGLIEGATLRGGIFETSSTTPRTRIDTTGIYFQVTTLVGKYGTFKYGDGTKYGVGVSAFLFNNDYPILAVTQERNYADIRLYNRNTNPSGAAKVGDLACVNAKLMICTESGTPGTFQIVGTQN